MSTADDPRPRPQYGEYASPEEQRAHIREPLPEPAQPMDVAPAAGGHGLGGSLWGGTPTPPPWQATPAPGTKPALAPIHRIITLAMLAFGAVQVLSSSFSFFDYGALMTQVFETWGVRKDIADQPRPAGWGIVLFAVLLGGYALTVWLSLKAIKAQRVSWWIPVVGAIVTWIVLSIVLGVALAGDPAYAELVRIMTDPARVATPTG